MKTPMIKSKFSRDSLERVNFTFKSFNYDTVSAMISRNAGLAMVGIILRLSHAMGGKPSKSLASNTRVTLGTLAHVAQSQGLPGLVKFLKSVSVRTQQYLGGYTSVTTPRISVTKSGIPRLFPPMIRRNLRSSQSFFIRWSLTIASLYRDVLYEGPLKLSSITDPFKGREKVFSEIDKYIPIFTKVILSSDRLRSFNPAGWVKERYKAFPITTSSPQRGKDPVASSSILVLIRSALALDELTLQSMRILSRLYRFDYPTPFKKGPIKIIEWIRSINSSIPDSFKPVGGLIPPIGKLGLKVEAAGKMRVFAMVDPWTQWLLAPLHKGLFHILERIPQDGTFNQHGPLRPAFKNNNPLFSMDLSSATDRLPLSLQSKLISTLFELTPAEGKAWEHLLVGRRYALSNKMRKLLDKKSDITSVTYAVGQPMGALSSWAMLAYTHHFIVQCAAWQSGVTKVGSWFKHYAVLGDDIVIFNAAVSKQYHRLITDLGVECNLAKSIMSPSGDALEFAKKTFYRGTNVSPVPLKEYFSALTSVPALVEFGKTYHLTFAQLIATAGFGYRVLGGLTKPLKKLNLKIQYIVFGMMAMNPRSLMQSFYDVSYFRNETQVMKAYLLFVHK